MCLYERVRQMELKKEGERNGSSSAMLSTFVRFVTGERIMEAVKWGCVNMLAIEEHAAGLPVSQSPKIKRLNK